MRLVLRDPARAPDVRGAEVVHGDYARPETLSSTMRAGDRVFMVSMWIGGDVRLDLHRNFIRAATKAGVEHVVYLSFVNAGPNAVFSHAREHGATEQMLRESGLNWTAIRNSMYADDIPGWFDPDGVAREPGEDARMSFSYRPELAEVIVAVLTQPGRHVSRAYDITTSDSASMAELAGIATEVTGHRYAYEPISDAAWVERWKAQGRKEWALEAGLTSYAALRAGEFDVVSDDFEKVTGRKAASIAQVVKDLEAEMPLAVARRLAEGTPA